MLTVTTIEAGGGSCSFQGWVADRISKFGPSAYRDAGRAGAATLEMRKGEAAARAAIRRLKARTVTVKPETTRSTKTMSYENAPSTQMLATHCAICARPLRDAESVETGIGPDCRAKHGIGEARGPADWDAAEKVLLPTLMARPQPDTLEGTWRVDARRAVNILIHAVAVLQDGPIAAAYVTAIAALGYRKAAVALGRRMGAVFVEDADGWLFVRAPYSERFVVEARRIPGIKFEGKRENGYAERSLPADSKRALWGALKASFPAGTIVFGDRAAAVL